MKKVLSVIIAIAMSLSVIVITPTNTQAAIGQVTLDIEKLTIGQGLYQEPVVVDIYSGDTVDKVFMRYLQSVWGQCYYIQNTWYLTKLIGADSLRRASIPNEIANIGTKYNYVFVDEYGFTHPAEYTAPSTNTVPSNSDTILGEGDYHAMSGWIVTINDKAVLSGASLDRTDNDSSNNPSVRNIYKPWNQISVRNGDVIRVQFSVYGYGADLGIDTSEYTGISPIKLASKTELLKSISDVNSNKAYWIVYPNVKAAYDSALAVAKTYNPSQWAVNNSVTKLKAAIKAPQNPPVGTATISSAKNVKGKKIKVTVKKVSGATGYQIKYGNNKKLVNKKKKKWKATTVRTTKTSYTTKTIKNIKSKKAYVKVRAYKKVNGKYVYGKWTSVKTVKIKK